MTIRPNIDARALNARLMNLEACAENAPEGTYEQAPYQRVTKERWDQLRANLKKIDWESLYSGDNLPEAQGELYCSSDSCEVQ